MEHFNSHFSLTCVTAEHVTFKAWYYNMTTYSNQIITYSALDIFLLTTEMRSTLFCVALNGCTMHDIDPSQKHGAGLKCDVKGLQTYRQNLGEGFQRAVRAPTSLPPLMSLKQGP